MRSRYPSPPPSLWDEYNDVKEAPDLGHGVERSLVAGDYCLHSGDIEGGPVQVVEPGFASGNSELFMVWIILIRM